MNINNCAIDLWIIPADLEEIIIGDFLDINESNLAKYRRSIPLRIHYNYGIKYFQRMLDISETLLFHCEI